MNPLILLQGIIGKFRIHRRLMDVRLFQKYELSTLNYLMRQLTRDSLVACTGTQSALALLALLTFLPSCWQETFTKFIPELSNVPIRIIIREGGDSVYSCRIGSTPCSNLHFLVTYSI